MSNRRIALVAGLAALTFTAAACGDDTPDPVEAPPTTETMTEDTMMTEDSMVEPMTEDSMVDEPMTEDSMVDTMTEDSMVDEMTGTTVP
jgi:hypothetical protein